MSSHSFSRFHRFLRVVAFGLLVASVAAAAEAKREHVDPKMLPAPKRVVVPRLSGAATIDGQLDEAVWAKAAVLDILIPTNGPDRPREETLVRIWYDDTALYLGWTCRDTDIQATFTARDSKFWEEEVAEFFVTPKDLTRYFELQWNPLGGVFDAIIDNDLDEHGVSKRFRGKWDYTAKGMKSAVKVRGTVADGSDTDEFWQVEVAIPFSDFDVAPPKPGEVWRANFFRFNRGNNLPPEPLSWSLPILPGFHQPTRFGFLEFGK